MGTTKIKYFKTLCCFVLVLIMFCMNNISAFAAETVTIVIYHADDASSGSVPVDYNEYKDGEIVTVMGKGNLQRNASMFIGWNTDESGNGTYYQQGDTFIISGTVNLYAQWGVIKDIHKPYMSGYPDGNFGPSNNITRGEVAQMFYNLNLNGESVPKLAEKTGGKNLTDITDPNAWFYEAVVLLSDYGIISGYDDGTFKPGSNIKRAEFASMAAKAMNSPENFQGELPFPDVSGKHWALSAITYCRESNFISGYDDGNFHPDDYIKRSEVVAIVNKMLGRKKLNPIDDGAFPDISRSHWAVDVMLEAGTAHGYYINSEGEEIWLPLYSVTYIDNGADNGDVPVDDKIYTEDMLAVILSSGNLTKDGYNFTGWNIQEDGQGKNYKPGTEMLMPKNNVVLYANWVLEDEIKEPEIIKDISSVMPCGDIFVKTGIPPEELSLPVNVSVSFSDGYSGSLKVLWDTEVYNKNAAGTYNLTGVLLLPDDGSITNDNNLTAAIRVIVEEDIIPEKYLTVTFSADGASTNVKVKSGEKVNRPADPEKKGFKFIGWYCAGILYDFDSEVEEDILLSAVWEEELCTVTFDTDSDTNIPPITAAKGTVIEKPENPVKVGFKFLYWLCVSPKGDYIFDFSQPINEDILLKAIWETQVFKISYHRNGASGNAPIDQSEYKFGDTAVIEFDHNMIYGDYTFLGWAVSPTARVPDYTVSGERQIKVEKDVELYAAWSLAAANANGEYYDTLEEALLNTDSGTIHLSKSDILSGEFTNTGNVTIVVSGQINLTVNNNCMLVLDELLCESGAALINNGVIIGKVSADFAGDAASEGFGNYKGSGVIFSSMERYNGIGQGADVLQALPPKSSGWASSDYVKGMLHINGEVSISTLVRNGSADTEHWVTFSYAVPENAVSIKTDYAAFNEGNKVIEYYDGSNSFRQEYERNELKDEKFLHVELSAQFFQKDGYELYCPSYYTLADGSCYMELYQVSYDVDLDRTLSVDVIDGNWNILGDVYTIPSGKTVTLSSGIMLGHNSKDIEKKDVPAYLRGTDDTSVLKIEAGVSLLFIDHVDINYYDSTKLPLFDSDFVGIASDMEFWWDTGIEGWVKR